jgi:hypothetical protein
MNVKPETLPLEDIKIAAYLDGRLAPGERDAVEHLLNGTKEFREYLALMRQTLANSGERSAEGQVPERLREKVVDLYRQKRDVLDIVISLTDRIFRVLRWSPAVGFSLPAQAATTRSDREMNHSMAVIRKTFDDVVVEVCIEHISASRCNFMIRVTDRTTKAPCDNVRAELMSKGREYASCLLKHGEAIFEDINPGRYDVLVRRSEAICGRLAIRIDD